MLRTYRPLTRETTPAPPAASIHPSRQPERPITPRQHNISHSPPTRDEELVAFATTATQAVGKECGDLAAQKHPSSAWFAILTVLLFEVESRLQDRAPLSVARLVQLLTRLERLIEWPTSVNEPQPPYHHLYFPRLEQLLAGEYKSARRSIELLAKSQEPRAGKTRGTLEKSFKAFANVKTSAYGPGISDLARPTAAPTSDDEHTKYLQDLHTSFCELSYCNQAVDSRGFTANIAVINNLHELPQDDPFGRDVAFYHHHTSSGPRGEWKQAKIRMRIESQPNTKEVSAKVTTDKVWNFCQLVRSQDLGRLSLSLVNEKLFSHGYEQPPQKCRLSLSDKSAISLTDLIDSQCLRHEDQHKALLLCLIAKAVWQFYESDWMSEPWTERTVQFMQRYTSLTENKSTTLDYRPYISCRLVASPGPTAIVTEPGAKQLQEDDEHENMLQSSHIYPKVLALGIFLLNIELGYDFLDETSIKDSNPEYLLRPNAQHQIACDFIRSSKWNKRKTKTAVKQAIEICITPDTGKLGQDPKVIRERLLSKVVQPLEKLFADQWECGGRPETFDPGPIKANFLRNDQNAAQMIAGPAPQDANSIMGSEDGLVSQISNLHLHDWQLFGDETNDLNHKGKADETDAWFQNFRDYLDHHKIGRGNSEPIRVAIIDTGIDLSHRKIKEQLVAGRIKGCQSFVPGEDATVDESGHGTHIAGLVLQLTRNVDLYIAKIISQRVHGEEETIAVRERMVEALKHCRDIWKVNMISLSFGYSTPSTPDTVWNEIEACWNSKLVVFAAASNDAGNSPRTYPGEYKGVLCIYSATGRGNPSDFNPSYEKNDDNFTFVGEELNSYWTAELPNHDGSPHDRERRRSGTSFATPIAVATAAFMVEFIRRKTKGYYWVYEPLSPIGIRIIFKEMSHIRQSYQWIDPGWYFKKYPEAKIKEDLIHALIGKRQR